MVEFVGVPKVYSKKIPFKLVLLTSWFLVGLAQLSSQVQPKSTILLGSMCSVASSEESEDWFFRASVTI